MKRYYLVNHFINEEPHQIVLCSLYMGLKIEEMHMKSILMMADALKTKPYWKELKPIHFGTNGYIDVELNFLEAINFETNKISMVRPIESLLNRMKRTNSNVVKILEIEKEVSKLIEMVYFSEMFWLTHPAKLALCIILVAFENEESDCDSDSIDHNGDIKAVLADNRAEIEEIKTELRKLRPFNRKENKESEKFELFRSWTKEFFKKPTLKRKNESLTNIPVM